MSYWIDYGNDKVGHSIRCSECGEDFEYALKRFSFCPNCGASMSANDEQVTGKLNQL